MVNFLIKNHHWMKNMDKIPFFKMSGSGNDFILIDNREKVVEENLLSDMIKKVCRRKMSVGADGFILVEKSDQVDFRWRFFNSDGSLAEMCGNGARCAARFAYLIGIAGKEIAFETDAGIVLASITHKGVKIKMPDPKDIKIDYLINLEKVSISVNSVNTGVPHVVMIVDNLDCVDVFNQGREIRYFKSFAPAGTNVNFVSMQNDGSIAIRTYERGVEDETLACGTGSIAGAVVMACKEKIGSPVKMLTKSGEILNIFFNKNNDRFTDIYLEGDARVIYSGKLWREAWMYNN
jgi:diaminopimelate epimerase